METDNTNMLSILSNDDNNKIPDNIRQLIKSEIDKKNEELFVAKKLVDSTKLCYDKQVSELQGKLTTIQEEQKNDKILLKNYSEELEELKNRIQTSETEINNFRTNVQRLEEENENLRKQRNTFGDERDDLFKIVQRREIEMQRYQEDITNLTNQIDSITKSKCEALMKVEECDSRQMSLEFREKRIDQERELFTKQIQSLNNELNEQKSELLLFRKNNTRDKVALETKLFEKSEELENYKQQMDNLKMQNTTMSKTIEDLLTRLQEEHENSLKIKDYFDQEINAQTKVANLYKEMGENSETKTSELTNAIKELQNLLSEASQQYGELETKSAADLEKFQQSVNERDQVIKNLRMELTNANDLLKAAKEENLEQTIEGLSPTAAAVSRLVKSGMTLTQIYTEYAKISEELVLEKNENKNLKLYIETILQEIEEKAPLLKQLNEDYQASQENLRLLAHQVDERDNETIKLREEHSQAISKTKQLERDNERYQQEITDMGKQICFLLHEVEVSRAGFTQPPKPSLDNSDLHNSSDVISRHLIEFRDIQELQEKNRMLTALVRELSSKAELYENTNQQTGKMDTSQLEKIETLENEVKELQEKLNLHQKMMETSLNQRDMYKRLYEQNSQSSNTQLNVSSPRTPVHSTNKVITDITPVSPGMDIQALTNELKLTVKKLETAEKSLNQLKNESEQYRQIRAENEKHLHEQLEKVRDEFRDLTKKNCKLASQNEFSDHKLKILKTNVEGYKKQIASLEEKARVYNEIIIKHEASISLLKDETLECQHKAARNEVEATNLKEECSLLRQNETRLLRELEGIRRERSSQEILLANLETIKASIERVNAESQMRVENRLEESYRENGVLQRKLKELEQSHHDELQQISREMQKAQSRLEEENHLRNQAQQEVQFSRDAIQQRDEQLLSLSAKVRSLETQTITSTSTGNNSSDTQKINELTQKLKNLQADLESVRTLLATEKRHSSSYNEIANGLELQVKELQERIDKETKQATEKLSEHTRIVKESENRIKLLEEDLAKATAGSNINVFELNRQLDETKLKLEETLNNFENLKSTHETSQEMLLSVSEAMQATEDKYNREVILHSQDIQVLSTLKEETNKLKDELQSVKESLKIAKSDLEIGHKGWKEREVILKKEQEQYVQQIEELQAQNNILHDQIEALGAKLSLLHHQTPSGDGKDLNVSLETTAVLEDITTLDEKGSKQLLRLVKFLRKEKDLSLSKFEMIRAENARLKAQLEMIQQQLDDSKETLAKERQNTDSNLLSSSKQTDLLRKLETLNAITDSNRVLREERNSLAETIKGMSDQITKLNIEIEPLRKKNIEQSTRLDSLETENTALRNEAARLQQNIQSLIERSNKHSPADWRMLNTERETLSRQLNVERENTNKQREELRILRGKINALETQLNQIQKQTTTTQEELTQTKNDLTNTKSLYEQSQKDAKTKEESLNDLRTKELNIRKIARKYKVQFEELTKKVEEDKVKMQAEVAAAASQVEISSDKVDQLREEGRREVEARLKEAVDRHSDVVKGLNDQVSSSQEEAESLKRENERAKAIVKTARLKIIQLSEDNKNMNRQLSEVRSKVTNDQDIRQQLQGRIDQLEKDLVESRGERESMQQRIKLLQGMLEKQQGPKPSTSSGPVSAGGVGTCGVGQGGGGGGSGIQPNNEKTAHPNEPPTANIKPIPGPSNSTVKQQQQSVNINRSSRGDTPFASIRPMTMPTRTVAVIPTSQTSSTGMPPSSGSQAVQVQPSPSTSAIVTPQQCAVHTTGSSTGERPTSEILAASPTSSMNDYVPPSTSAPSSSSATGVTVGVSSGTPSTSTSSSQPVSHLRTPTPSVTVHPTKLQQQPTQAMSIPQGSPQQQQSQPQQSQGQQGAESTQDFEPEPMDVAPQQVPSVSQPSTSGTNVASVVVASASSQPQPSNIGQLTAVAMVMPRMEGQAQQTIGQMTSPTSASNIVNSENSNQQPQPGSSGQSQESQSQPGTSASQSTTQSATQSASSGVVCSQASSSSSTVTTTQQAAKRIRQDEEDNSPTSMPGDDDKNPQSKRLRLCPLPGTSSRELFSEVEYQVPTSSQRDHEDEVIVLNSGDEGEEDDENLADEGLPEEPDDGPEFEDENYELEPYDRDEPENYDEGPDIDSETDANNEAENINVDSDEVPNPSGSGSVQSAGSGGRADGGTEATSSDNRGSEQGNTDNDNCEGGSNADTPNTPGPSIVTPASTRSRTLPSLARQQQLVLPGSYDECTDDSIVPSTPTLYVPRRMDAFGEAVSSPQVPQRRFTFTDAHQPPSHGQNLGGSSSSNVHGNVGGSGNSGSSSTTGITGAGSSSTIGAGTPLARAEGIIEDTRIDLSQLEESGTGRSVPSTPLQVSPQGELADGVGREAAQGSIPAITITEASANLSGTATDDDLVDDASTQDLETLASPDGQTASTEAEAEALEDEPGDGVTSEGEKPVAPSDSSMSENSNDPANRTEESREAEAIVEGGMMTRSRRGSPQTARRSGGIPRSYNRGRGLSRPTPIIWSEPGSSQPSSGFVGRGAGGSGNIVPRGSPAQQMMRGGHMRGRRTRKTLNIFNNFQRF